jgi:hypothetical protein
VNAILRPAEPARVELSGGQVTLIDTCDLSWVSEYAWRLSNRGYACRTIRLGTGRAAKKSALHLHRVIAGAQPGQLVDHLDGDPLNNQRANLRITDHLGNSRNIRNSKNAKCGSYKGVYFVRKSGKWAAHIGAGERKPNGKARVIHLGCFATPELAARAYDDAAIRYFGEHAATNFLSPADEKWALEQLLAAERDHDPVANLLLERPVAL